MKFYTKRLAIIFFPLFLNVPCGFCFVTGRARARAPVGGLSIISHEILRRKTQTDDDSDAANEPKPPVSSFESMVRNLTGNSSYRFGDLTKGALSTTTHAFEDVAKKTHLVDDDYHFGDITKGAISSISEPVTSALSSAEHSLHLVREANIHELVALTNVMWSGNLTGEQRKETWVVFLQLGAIAVLAYSFIANLQAGMVMAVAWGQASKTTGVSPLAPGNWARFLQIQSTLNMIFGGPFLPARAIITIKWFFPYRRFTVGVLRRLPLRTKYPLLNRIACILFMWIVVNLISVGVMTAGMVWMSSLWTGVPVFPPAA